MTVHIGYVTCLILSITDRLLQNFALSGIIYSVNVRSLGFQPGKSRLFAYERRHEL